MNFTPSSLCGIDETHLTSPAMEFYSKSYAGTLDLYDNYMMNPYMVTKEDLMQDGEMKFPRTRIII